MLIDTHAHLYWNSFKKDLDTVIQNCLDADVKTIINVGVDLKSSETALKQVHNKLNKVGFSAYSTIGIHPHESIHYDQKKLENDIKKLEDIYKSDPAKVVGVGECGLDFLFDPKFTPKDLTVNQLKDSQRQLFQAQIDLAKRLNLPLVVHCRDDRSQDSQNSEAWDETLKMIGNHPAILHCYSGLPHTTKYILQTTNLLVSFAATLTYPKNEYLRETAKIVPLEKIVLETDCPFLPPQSKRGQRNEPSTVKELAQLIADIKDTSLEQISKQTTKNTKRIFKINSV